MKRVIVTGATGFIGQNLVGQLLACGVEVVAVVRSREKADKLFGKACAGLTVIQCELSQIEQLPSQLKEPIDACFHFAWMGVSGPDLLDGKIQLKNIEYTLNLLETIQKMGVKKFVGAGSIHELECHYASQQGEMLALSNMYKSAKIAAHYMVQAFCNYHGITFCWPIITNTYGVGEKSARLIISTIEKLRKGESPTFSFGTQPYDFVEVTDVAKALYLIGLHGHNNRNYMICNPGPVRSLRSYLEELGHLVNPMVPLLFGSADVSPVSLPKTIFQCGDLVEDTGFQVEVSFSQGILKILKSLEKDR